MTTLLRKYWPLFLLGILALLFLGDIWFAGRTLLLRDFFFGDLNTRTFVGKALLNGGLPTWSSSSQCGIPFLASPYSVALYPLHWVFTLPSVAWATRLWWTFHLFLAALSCYTLARYWMMSVAPALFAAISFTFCTFTTAWIEFASGQHCMAWAPLVIVLISQIIDRTAENEASLRSRGRSFALLAMFLRNAHSIVGLAVILALQLLASGEIFYYCCLLYAAYGLARWAYHGSWRVCVISMLWLVVAGGLALGLVMPQLLPTFELLKYSIRAGEVNAALDMASEHPRHWLAMLLPFLYGRPGYPDVYWAPSIYEFANGTCYVGILPLISTVFCCLGLKRGELNQQERQKRFLVCFLAAVLVGGLLLAAGKYTPVYPFLHHWLPGFGHFRFPTKLHFYVAFALAMLGAVGLQLLLDSTEAKEDERVRIRLWWVAVGVFGVFLSGFLLCFFSDRFLPWLMAYPATAAAEQTAELHDYAWAVAFTLTGLGLFALLAFRRGSAPWVQGGILAVAFINLWIISRQVHPTGPDAIYEKRPTQLLDRLQHDVPLYRYYASYSNAQQYIYGDNRPDLWQWVLEAGATSHLQGEGLLSINPGGLELIRYTKFFRAMKVLRPPVSEKLADMLSLRYVISGAPIHEIYWGDASWDVQIEERASSLPRAFVVSQWRTVMEAESVLQTILDDSFDPRTEAIIEPLAGVPVPPDLPAASSGDAPGGEIRSFTDTQDSVTMTVASSGQGLLVLGDTWYPGWTVTVDGVKRPIFQTNYLFRGVFLDPGLHQVVFTFKPTYLALGGWLCAISLSVCLGLLGLSRWHPATSSLPVVRAEAVAIPLRKKRANR